MVQLEDTMWEECRKVDHVWANRLFFWASYGDTCLTCDALNLAGSEEAQLVVESLCDQEEGADMRGFPKLVVRAGWAH